MVVTINYLFDPLCGWTYGSLPAVRSILHNRDIDLRLYPTGQFSGRGARAIFGKLHDHILEVDQRIIQLSGQTFSETYREAVLFRSDAKLDSTAATLALTAVNLTRTAEEFSVLNRIQTARYVYGQDITSEDYLITLLDEAGYGEASSLLRTSSLLLYEANLRRLLEAQAIMARAAVNGSPAFVLGVGKDLKLMNQKILFGGIELFEKELESHLLEVD